MERREIITLPLAPLYKVRLTTSGYLTVADLQGVTAEKLSKDTNLNTEVTGRILQLVLKSTSKRFAPKSAWAVLEREESSPSIVTFSQHLDQTLGGGVECGRLTEISGLPGTGKTQLCLQLACDMQIPSLFGGLEGEAIYLDADGRFVPERITDIAMATVKHCEFIANSQKDEEVCSAVSSMTLERLLSGIHVYSCHNKSQLLAVINLLPGFIEQHNKVKLVLLDSVAAHFKHDVEDLSLRTRMLTHLAQTLVKLAAELNISVVVTNKMTTRVRHGAGQSSRVIPALGDTWGHACCTRLLLERLGGDRWASLTKSPSQPQARAPFLITKDGIRDVPSESQSSHAPISDGPPDSKPSHSTMSDEPSASGSSHGTVSDVPSTSRSSHGVSDAAQHSTTGDDHPTKRQRLS